MHLPGGKAGGQAASGAFLPLPVDGKCGGFPPALGGPECRQVCGLLGGIQQRGTGPDSSTGKSQGWLWRAARALLATGLFWFVRGFLCVLSCPDEAHTCILQLASKPGAAVSILTPLFPLLLHLEHPSTTGHFSWPAPGPCVGAARGLQASLGRNGVSWCLGRGMRGHGEHPHCFAQDVRAGTQLPRRAAGL